jgi:hypothetical protein
VKILNKFLNYFFFLIKKFFNLFPYNSIVYRTFLVISFWVVDYRNNFGMDDKKKIIIIYDCLVSPPTFGDFFRYLMLARYFKKKGKIVEIIIINQEYRGNKKNSWGRIKNNKKKINEILNLYNQVSLKLLNSNAHFMNWNFFYENYLHNGKYNIFLKSEVIKRNPTYLYSNYYLNKYLKHEKENFKEKFFLKKNKKINIPKKIGKNFISVGLRYTKVSNEFRNVTVDEINLIITKLKQKYKNIPIILLTSYEDFLNLKNINLYQKKNVYFSKSFNKNIFDDADIILNSKYYLQLKGGGISDIALFSKIKYLIIAQYPGFIDKIFFSKNKKIFVWQKKNQIYTFYQNTDIFFNLI